MATQKFGIRGLGSAAQTSLTTALRAVARHRRRAALTEQHRLHFDLLCKAMDDPALAAVLDTYESVVDPQKQRQFLFANALYVNALYYYRIGAMTKAELYGHLRIICQNQIFREYWEATRPHRKSLPSASEEAVLGRMMDELVQDLDSADTDEWWVVGNPPEESL
ncbi:DUF6082 family protein [Streptomyces sp. NPDC004539]|uniref:DUF6082 family protein n=1 Tax=Streptomyces sp. NPDC004539 TaxID=3154280 RepID=UPI0033B164DF